jgi:hypothetical protein
MTEADVSNDDDDDDDENDDENDEYEDGTVAWVVASVFFCAILVC